MELESDNYYPAAVLRDVYLVVSTQAKKKGLEFQMDIGEGIPNRLFGDKVRLRGVMVNILNNAVKYTKEGKVTMKVEVVEKNQEEVLLRISSIDTGVGIRKEELPLVFESFSQLDRKVHQGVEGTGLGLSIVKGYVELMGDKISVKSIYGEGSTFTIELTQKIVDPSPMVMEEKMEQEVDASYSMGNLRVRDVRVLVVDDNHVNLKVAKNSMEYYGLQVDIADGGKKAVGLCQAKKYDIVFMDQIMPEMDGKEAMQEIRKFHDFYGPDGQGKIVVLTANAISGVRDQLLEEGFDEYLGKPINFKQLERILQKFLPKEKLYYSETGALDDAKQEMTELQAELEGFDLENAFQYCGGTKEKYLTILESVYRTAKKQMSQLKETKLQGKINEFTIHIHALKGQSMNIGAVALAEDAKKLEYAGKKEDISYVEEFLHQIKSKMEQLDLEAMGRLLRERVAREEETGGNGSDTFQ